MLAFLFAVVFVSPVPIFADPRRAPPSLDVPYCAVPPKIDGILNDPCWKTAAHVAQFYRLTSPVTQQTEAWVCADSRRLYIAFHCYDSQPRLIRAEETQRNGNTYSDDYVQVDIDSEGTHVGQSQFMVTARGIQNESLEGGTAQNITWAGDWHAATRATLDGWCAELSIPFALLRYPKDAHQFGVQFERKLARETSISYWPERPPRSQIRPIQFYGLLTNLFPKFAQPQPVFLPYALLRAGQGDAAQFGLDVKYPISTGLTALGTINPDFGTVEQSVASIAFSYAPQTINDQRPFFEEGSNYFPGLAVLYTPNIPAVDEGVKITGKEGDTSIGAFAVNKAGQDYQRADVVDIAQDVNSLSTVQLAYAGDDQAGKPGGNVLSTGASYGAFEGRDIIRATASHIFTWEGGQQMGGEDFYRLQYVGHAGHPTFNWTYNSYAPNFVSELGYVPFTNYHGSTYYVQQRNTFDAGALESYSFRVLWMDQTNISGGGVFRENANISLYLQGRSGMGAFYAWSQGQHLQYNDHMNEFYLEWSDNASTGGGYIDYQAGTQEDDQDRLLQAGQNYGLSQKLILDIGAMWQDLGGTVTSQLIFTPDYKLGSDKSIAARLVTQNNEADFYLVYSQLPRRGSDIYLIFGNPNSLATQSIIQLKVVTPF